MGESGVWDVEGARPKELTCLPGWPAVPSTGTRGARECGWLWVELEAGSIGGVGSRSPEAERWGQLGLGQQDLS